MTVVGTRPELIRLSLVFEQMKAAGIEHHLVHTGQNYDPRLSDIFFEELELPAPDAYLAIQEETVGAQIGAVIARSEARAARVRARRPAHPRGHQQRPLGGGRRPERDPDLPHGGRQPLLRLARARGEEPQADRPHLGLAAPLHPALPRVPAGRGAVVPEDPSLGQPDHGHPRALPAQVVGLRRAGAPRPRGARLRAGHRAPPGDGGLPRAAGGDLRGAAARGRGDRPADRLEPPPAHPREARAARGSSCTRTSSCTSRSGSSTSCAWRRAPAAS